MDDEQSLLAAVAAAPDDEAPKLIIADFYQDQGGDLLARAFRWAASNRRMPRPAPDQEAAWEWERTSTELLVAHAFVGRLVSWGIEPRLFNAMPLFNGCHQIRRDGRVYLRSPALQPAFVALAMALEEAFPRDG